MDSTVSTIDLSSASAPTQPCQMTATAAAGLIGAKKLSCEELLRSCLARIAARDAAVRAWLYLDPEQSIRNARELDKQSASGGTPGVLHGLPWGVKDVFDTADMPTTQNSPIYPGLRVGRDAAAVAIARHSGGLILGKTDTVEFASSGRKALTRNPWNPAHTPGGSSSGSGAAVGDFQVPLAFGTQTGGSHIRPSSFNGIYGLKPTWGAVSREGLKMAACTLDTVGWYGRCVDDLILVAEAFRLARRAEIAPVGLRGLRVGLCRSPVWAHIEPAGEAALLLAAQRLSEAGAVVADLELPSPCEGLAAAHRDVSHGEGGVSFLPEYIAAPGKLAHELRDRVENRRGLTPAQLLASYALADRCRPLFDALFGPELDVVLTPSAPGEAPEGLHTTGNAVFNSNWTLLHVPCVGIPVMLGPKGLPVGVTLVGPRFGDARLLAIAKAAAEAIDADPGVGLRGLW
jgi:Asp-tRNA(Asn)/Glu-tRNA(Gln) amidotransferase A subunit family amidase